jgi:hypothetical protein
MVMRFKIQGMAKAIDRNRFRQDRARDGASRREPRSICRSSLSSATRRDTAALMAIRSSIFKAILHDATT